MYCKHCGAPIADDSKFCPSCGQNLTENTATATEENHAAPAEPFETEYETVKEPATEEPSCNGEPMAEEPPYQEEASSFAQQEYNAQPTYDPFSGPAHPSVKKNIIRACVALGIATVISIILMVVSIVTIAKNGSLEEAFSAMNTYEEEIVVEEETQIPMDLPDTNTIALGNAGNTVGNAINNGLAVSDGNGGAYYADINTIYYRSAGNTATPIAVGNGDSCTNLNIKDNNLYYIVNSNNNTKQDIVCFELTSETETVIASLDETISYMMIYGNELYYATELNIMAMDLTSESTRTVYTAEKPLYDVFVTDNGIYFAQEENEYYGLYRINHNETTASLIEEGYYFCIDNEQLYSSDVDYTGRETIYQKSELGDVAKAVYTFAENTFLLNMNIQNNVLYCITETEETNGSFTYALRIINLENGEELVVDKDFTAEENPFYSPNVGGEYLFYYDNDFDFGIRVYEF